MTVIFSPYFSLSTWREFRRREAANKFHPGPWQASVIQCPKLGPSSSGVSRTVLGLIARNVDRVESISQYLVISSCPRNTRNVSSARGREPERQKYEWKKERRGGLVPELPEREIDSLGTIISWNIFLVRMGLSRVQPRWPRREVPSRGGEGGTEMESSIDKRSGSRGEPFNHATPIKPEGFQCSKWGPLRAVSKPNYSTTEPTTTTTTTMSERRLVSVIHGQWLRIYFRSPVSPAPPRNDNVAVYRNETAGLVYDRSIAWIADVATE